MTMGRNNYFRFGVEIELLLESPGKKHKTWESLAKDLSKRLTRAAIRNRVDDSNLYAEWSIVREVTVQDPAGRNPYQYGVELVSPIHNNTSIPTLQAELITIFNIVNTTTTLIPTPRCSSHIHVSRSPTPFSPLELAALVKATLYFEPALDALLPAERCNPNFSHWTQSPRCANNPALSGLSLSQCLSQIDLAASSPASMEGDTRPIIDIMNLVSKDSRYGVIRQKKAHFVRGKTYKWDFSGLLATCDTGDVVDRGIGGTVEFRQPPGSVRAEDAVVWVTLGVAFVAGAVLVGQEIQGDVEEEGGSLEELWGVLETGREVLGWEGLGVLEGLFAGVGR
ncbi:hypothetical protein C8A01DRAFT_31969 [Parachaetomium inaequale]|uniref:Amidoligase enzyme n=1 Tax=Parachaetomium inaequale TaxID=2588326 RepID=A0AAN6PSQ1_9PEZI|nr:hypothetical protein C8A01DRAFT_31969 [Parachaetomium inaequale]